MEDVRKLKENIEELKETALIVRDLGSRYELAVALLQLNEIEPIPEAELNYIRQRYDLRSDVWVPAELKVKGILK
ncbi:MAG: hypothetical protein ACI4KB_01685 [Oscillospiraceae bacterium]